MAHRPAHRYLSNRAPRSAKSICRDVPLILPTRHERFDEGLVPAGTQNRGLLLRLFVQLLLYTGAVMSCLFCQIIEGSVASAAVYQDDKCYAFADINPQAPVHVLIAPREHLVSLAEAGEEHPALLGHLLWVGANLARKNRLAKGYRVVINTGEDGGQTVDHLHVHLLGGRPMTWPPG
jgi:histidine triad (HIT) family protein